MASISAKGLIGLAIAVAIMVAVIPQAIENISSTDSSNWSSATQSLWNLMPLIIIAVIVLGIAGGIAKSKGMFVNLPMVLGSGMAVAYTYAPTVLQYAKVALV